MPKQLNYQLNEKELKEIEAAQRSGKGPQVRVRATGIHLLHQGKKPAEVAELLNVSPATIYNWHESWRKEGIAGLADRARSGRPPLANAAYRAQVEALMATDPVTLGYGFTCWTIERLLAHLANVTGITMSSESFRQLLDQLDYVYRRPKHDLSPLQDPAAKARAQALLDELKKKPQQAKSTYSLWTKRP